MIRCDPGNWEVRRALNLLVMETGSARGVVSIFDNRAADLDKPGNLTRGRVIVIAIFIAGGDLNRF